MENLLSISLYFWCQTTTKTGFKQTVTFGDVPVSFHANLHFCGIPLFTLQSRGVFMWTAIVTWENNHCSLKAANCPNVCKELFCLAVKVQLRQQLRKPRLQTIHFETTAKCQSKSVNQSQKAPVKSNTLHLCCRGIFLSIKTYNKQHSGCLSDRQKEVCCSMSLTKNKNHSVIWNWALAKCCGRPYFYIKIPGLHV